MLSFTQLNDMFENDKKANFTSLQEYKEAEKYYHGDQLPPDALAILAERGQPPYIENIYKMIVNKILGYKIQASQEIRVVGRIESTRQKADLLQDILRSFNQSKVYDREIYLRDRDLLFGMGILELWIVKDKDGNNKITLKHIPTESFLIDKFSTDLNALDSTRFHKILNISQIQSLELDINPLFSNDYEDKRAIIIESWIKEADVWNRYIWQNNGTIYRYDEKPFKNGAHPFVVSKLQQDNKLRWYGLFRDLKGVQDSINVCENRVFNMIGGSVKAFVEESAILDLQEFLDNINNDNAVIRVRDQALQQNKIHFIQHNAEIQALTQKTQEKRNLAKTLSGLNEEALGMSTNRQSGVAIAQRRDAGLMGLQIYVMQSDISDRILYEKFIDLVQHYYTKPQMFRITDDKNVERYFSINTNDDNTIKVGEYDLIYKTQLKQTGREERFAHWTELLKTISQIKPDIITSLFPIMLKDTDSSVVTDIQEVMAQSEKAAQESQQAQAKEAQAQKELEIAQLKAKIREMEAEALKKETQANYMQSQIQILQNMQQNPQNIESKNKDSINASNANLQTPPQTPQDIQNKLNKQMQLSTTDMR